MNSNAPLRPAVDIIVPTSRRQSAKSRGREREAWIEEQVRAVVTLTTGGSVAAHQSPIAETLTRVAAYPGIGRRTMIVVSDIRERSSVANLECRRLPTSERFEERLDEHGLLGPGTFNGINVVFAFAQARPLADVRCPSSIARERAIGGLFTHALERAGVARVVVSQGTPELIPVAPPPNAANTTESAP